MAKLRVEVHSDGTPERVREMVEALRRAANEAERLNSGGRYGRDRADGGVLYGVRYNTEKGEAYDEPIGRWRYIP